MKTCIQETIEHCSAEIARLQDLINGLSRLGGYEGTWRENPKSEGPKSEGNPKAEIRRGSELAGIANSRSTIAKGKAATAKGSAKPNGLGARVWDVVREMAGPFDMNEVHGRTPKGSMTVVQVNGALKQMARTGKIELVEKGNSHQASRYVVAAGKETAPAAKLGEDERMEVEAKLQTACVQRDRAREQGNEGLAEQWQRKIEQYERMLK